MVLFSLVASHRTVDLSTVARLADGAASAPLELGPTAGLSGSVSLSTCNRLEIYGELDDSTGAAGIGPAREALARLLAERSGVALEDVLESMDLHVDEDAAHHLFTVVSGLESAVVGEREITGQVRRALIDAQRGGTASGGLVRLFEEAAKTAREVGTSTSLGERGRSIVSVALDLADDVTDGRWPERRALVFGTGAYAGATMAALRDRGCADIEVHSASGRAEAFTANRGGTPVPVDGLREALERADVVIGCSGGSEPLSADQLPEGPLTVVDLALSRDFDPSVVDLDGVELITLESVKLAAPEATEESVASARRIVAEAAKRFRDRRSERDMDAAIVALRKHTMSVLDTELEKVRRQHGCTAAAEEVEFAMRRMVKSLLHEPTVRARRMAKEGRAEDYLTGLEALFGLSVDLPEQAAPVRAEPLETPAPTGPGSSRGDAAGTTDPTHCGRGRTDQRAEPTPGPRTHHDAADGHRQLPRAAG
ncbi:glutamyl-tRNA reductase [Kocuria palustris]|uniref:Glutamyl-tRNA reductase n=1 Tax=Kocuria palustris PEL TaxID=1236550 RepID=M2X8T2_9MICC|nr:glutamyl-tRNA reductase [Kocuria palustris]EME35536.1 Glutamyl-tRNA reductase [Kocuria palustris PEL]